MKPLRLFAALLLCAQTAAGQCPPATQLAELRSEAELSQQLSSEQMETRWSALLQAVRGCASAEQELEVLQARSDSLAQRGAVELARQSTRDWLDAAERFAQPRHQGLALLRWTRLHMLDGDLKAADQALQRGLELLGDHGSARERALGWSDLSRLQRRLGNYLGALRSEQNALTLRQAQSERSEVWRSLLSMATLYEQVELFDQARANYLGALAEVERLGVARDLSAVLNAYAGFLNDFGAAEAQTALQLAQRADLLLDAPNEPVRRGSIQLQIGRAWFGLHEYERAAASYDQARALAGQGDATVLLTHIKLRNAELALARQQPEAALELAQAALNEYTQQGNRHRLIKTNALLEQIHAARGDALAAAQAGREHFRLRNELLGAGASSKLGELLAQYALADARNANDSLRRENSDKELRLHAEERATVYLVALIGVLVAALLALGWRHRQSRRLNGLLRRQAAELEMRRAEVESRRIELAAAHERLKAQSAQLYQASITDPLTGLRNRAYGLNALRELLASSRALGLRPVVCMLDIDHFKQINDRYGHAVGDRTLERVAENLLIHAPADAIVARLGGEEFLFVLRDADPGSAMFQAELIRRRLLEMSIEHDTGVLKLTASIGVCHCASLEQPTVQAALRQADQALYQAKRAGRNCVRAA